MIQEVAFYQAVCDVCGTRHDSDDYAAWANPDQAVEAALESDWGEIEVADDLGPESRTDPTTGLRSRFYRFLLCEDHDGNGVVLCATCDADLDYRGWQFHPDALWTIKQTCQQGHESRIVLEVQA